MDKLAQLRIFVRVAERASFSAVARELHVTQSAVSKAISALESSLGSRLVSRSTRCVTLTEAGRDYYQRCLGILADLDDADAAVSCGSMDLTGTLTIAAPVPFGLKFISPCVVRFKALYPGLTINLDLNDHPLDLIEHNIDLAIRLGHLRTPGLVARKLGSSPFALVAAPAYLASHGTPTVPDDLAEHNCLVYSNPGQAFEWEFEIEQSLQTVAVRSNYRSNSLPALKDAALAGLGIARLPRWMIDTEIASGQLQLLLPQAVLPAFAIHAVFPSIRQVPIRVAHFVDFLRGELDASGGFRHTTPH